MEYVCFQNSGTHPNPPENPRILLIPQMWIANLYSDQCRALLTYNFCNLTAIVLKQKFRNLSIRTDVKLQTALYTGPDVRVMVRCVTAYNIMIVDA